MYSFDSKVRYSEVGEDSTLRPDALINYLQDCSAFQGKYLGIGTDYLEANGINWIIASWDIRINRMPKEGEGIIVRTWPYKLRGCFGYRNFAIDSPQGERLVYADSLWVMIDKATIHPIHIPQTILDAYELSPKIEMEDRGRKIRLPEGLVRYDSFFAREADIDINHHVNNANYLRFAAGFLPKEQTPKNIRIEYRNAAVLNDELVPHVLSLENEEYVVLKSAEDDIYCSLYFAF